MKKRIVNNVEYLTFKNFNKHRFLKHGFSTRHGGVSEGYFSSMNLRLESSDSKENVKRNFEIFLDIFDLKRDNAMFSDQVHDNKILVVTNKNEINCSDFDGLITDLSDFGLITFHADCVPVFFADVKKKVIGVAHSGWKGTSLNISFEMISKFKNVYNSELKDIIVGIGPSIGGCCYEVGKEVYDEFILKSDLYNEFFEKKNEKYMFDLKRTIEFDLIRAGIKKENIEISNYCTKCDSDLFFSHRAHGLKRGSMVALIVKQ
ncbi:peptidoglycan editing factor PgeF [Clostridiaceae bacterium HSG29]|nr:peptidoglycan editing factor PgeF [Clostridiaceae bacterium HSG29]